MCGICGFLHAGTSADQATLERMAETMATTLFSRGPDSGGTWADAASGVALGHRRLAILDLSAAGHQPMESACGRYLLSYNGEVYNFVPLRQELEALGVAFRGHTDTEVIVNGCAAWGVHGLTERLNGMFAFALWDTETRTLSLVRDRLGIKPLYWAQFGELLLFGSELKALRAHPGFTPVIDRQALAAYLRHNYVPAPLTIYEGVHKLPAGSILTLTLGGTPQITRYWSARQAAISGRASPLLLSPEDAVAELERLLLSAVGSRMVADVPLGAFLSGGVDSALVVALMQAQSTRPVKTFSIGFDVPGYNEAHHAKAVAEHLGTEHTEFYLTPAETMAVVPHLPEWFDEPFADASQIPTHLVSRLARDHVTVALSGDGGDELFSGYGRYAETRRRWQALRRLPMWARHGFARGLNSVPRSAWGRLFGLVPDRIAPPDTAARVHRLATVLQLDSPDALYRDLISNWKDPLALTGGDSEPMTAVWDTRLKRDVPDLTDRMRVVDSEMYLPDDILTKVDRMSMSVSLEARVPLLDHRVYEFSWAMPRAYLERDGVGKWPLRQVLRRHVPGALIDRPKMGFSVPIEQWLRGPLRDWAETLLSEAALSDGGYLNPGPIRAAWLEHQSGQRANHNLLWTVLMFQAWRAHWMP